MVLPLEDEGLGRSERIVRRLEVRRGEADDRLTEDRAESRFVDRLRDGLLEVVHVDEGRRAAPRHLDRGEERAPVAELLVDVSRLGGKDEVVQPLHELHVVRDAAQERHGDVAVAIDEPRDDEHSRGIDGLVGQWKEGSAVEYRDDSLPSMARAPPSTTRYSSSMVTTVPPAIRRSTRSWPKAEVARKRTGKERDEPVSPLPWSSSSKCRRTYPWISSLSSAPAPMRFSSVRGVRSV